MRSIQTFIHENKAYAYETLKELCLIPAPSHNEEKRAKYCKDWLLKNGATNVYIDAALNVVFPLHCDNSDSISVFAAHTDTVFPDTEPMPYFDDGEKIHCPGVADDTASVVALLMMAKYFIEEKIKPEQGIMFVCNACEEGLGNLKGTRQLFSDYKGRIKDFITFDSNLDVMNDVCVGSHRYEVEVLTEGGHSFEAFGNDNAIFGLSKIISEIYAIKVPEINGSKTTYNVGEISGGTSVNTIAQSAKMLCEYRSDNKQCMEFMQKKFEEIFERNASEKIKVNVKLIGERPCADIDVLKIEAMKEKVVPVVEGVIGKTVSFCSSSTDCNIPLSLGVPALCVGANMHEGIHTREENMLKSSLLTGIEVAILLGLKIGKSGD